MEVIDVVDNLLEALDDFLCLTPKIKSALIAHNLTGSMNRLDNLKKAYDDYTEFQEV